MTKVDEENKKPLSEAMFIIKDENGFIVRKETSDQNGIVKFENLTYGKYTYKEIFAPDGYEIDYKEYQFEIKELDEKIKVTCENKKETIVENIIADKNNIENKYNDKKKNLANKIESLSNKVDSKVDNKSDSTNNSLEKNKSLVSPATGDKGIGIYIIVGAISVIVLYLLNRKKDIE
ncbi:prealbumin-like fold domain-containing protein [Romboutsia lituseburensis]|uniref:prealbumin-like fold domain-containing protein n=1 Tax=Romboutsia lituseburensis TaxID=1537 RepID=UPI00215B5407|nr:prealbumin-like fold domain-containing protein [Romboutsia lituseburensis]MCR8743725.1 prealbumin-like fold domain-containing protein [Romboutsia lituseburensis]